MKISDEQGRLGWSNVELVNEDQSMAAPPAGVGNPHINGNDEANLSPTLNLFDWIDNLCQIKDAFGAESFVSGSCVLPPGLLAPLLSEVHISDTASSG